MTMIRPRSDVVYGICRGLPSGHESAQSVRVVCPCIYVFTSLADPEERYMDMHFKIRKKCNEAGKKKKDRKREKQLYSIYI